MKASGFQALLAQLGELSEVQRSALLVALKRKLPVAEAVDLIDTRFKADPCCGHCGSKAVDKWAPQNGLVRYRCKDCGRTINALTGTPPAQDYTPVLIVRDRHGATLDHVLPDLEGATFKCILKLVVAPDALLVSDGRAAYGRFADEAGLLHIALNASAGERSYGSYHIQNVNAYISRLKQWMVRFKGVATKYLATYLGWRRMIEREGDALSPMRCIVNALPQAAT